jgi:segregation and condensation protein B
MMTDERPDGQPDGLLPPLDVDDDVLLRGIAAVLFVADEPLTVDVLAETLGVDRVRVASALEAVGTFLDGDTVGIELREVAGGWRLMTAPASRSVLERWIVGARHGRLTQAALETLAVVAYRQPITRATVGEIRGVNPDGALRSLIARGMVTEVAREEGPGQAVLFGTTPQFLERMGLRTLRELPPVPPYLPDGPAPDEPDASGLSELRRFADLPREDRMAELAEEWPGWEQGLGQQRRELTDVELANRDYYSGRFAARVGGRVIDNWVEDVATS